MPKLLGAQGRWWITKTESQGFGAEENKTKSKSRSQSNEIQSVRQEKVPLKVKHGNKRHGTKRSFTRITKESVTVDHPRPWAELRIFLAGGWKHGVGLGLRYALRSAIRPKPVNFKAKATLAEGKYHHGYRNKMKTVPSEFKKVQAMPNRRLLL